MTQIRYYIQIYKTEKACAALFFPEQVGTHAARFFESLFRAPLFYIGMMPAYQLVRNEPAAEIIRTCILRIFEKPIGKALLLIAFGIGEHAGHEPADAICEYARRYLATRENIVADGYLLIYYLVYYPLVHTFVVPAENDEIVIARGKFSRLRLREHLALRRHIYNSPPTAKINLGRGYRSKAVVYRDGTHEHSLAAAVGSIVHPAVLILGIIADIVRMNLEYARLLRPADYALGEHRFYKLGEKSHYIKAHHTSSLSSKKPAIGFIKMPFSTSISLINSGTAGISTSPFSVFTEYIFCATPSVTSRSVP